MALKRTKRDKPKTPRPLVVGKTLRQVQISVDALREGMHVVQLDRPWTEVPVLFQQFTIDSDAQLHTLRHYCHWVWVDVDSSHCDADWGRLQLELHKPIKPLPEERPLVEELPRARAAHTKAQGYIDQLVDQIRSEQSPNVEDARPVVQECVSSILANPNAMFWLGRIRHEDAYTAEHCVRVAILAIAFGRSLELEQPDLVTLGLCGLLHDIGKLKVPDAILNKPASLDAEEMAVMKRHTEYGHGLLSEHHQLEPIVRDAALSHHERIDGTGYPNAVPEWRISRFSRIISIVDAFDAMTSDRCYRAGCSTSEALRLLYRYRGQQFDAELVEHFIRMIGVYPPGSLVELNTGEVALVLATNPNMKLTPRVEVVLDGDKRPCESRMLDLSQHPRTEDGQTYAIKQPLPDGAYGFTLQQRIEQQIKGMQRRSAG
ncbi:HD-GYP domain-containing protein [Marinobacteraceae bacterium S3BR75-40.1]